MSTLRQLSGALLPLGPLLLTLLLLTSCRGQPARVLDLPDAGPPPTPIDSCERALSAMEGEPCVEFDPACFDMSACCFSHYLCELGHLLILEDCGLCAECWRDSDCGPMEWCVGIGPAGGTCTPCPEFGDCAPCPDDLVPLVRNGCSTCDCLPPSQCTSDEDCMPGPAGMAPICVQGASCACDDPACCANVCATPECFPPEPPPEGCFADCGAMDCPEGICRHSGCRCVENEWVCDVVCSSPEGVFCG